MIRYAALSVLYWILAVLSIPFFLFGAALISMHSPANGAGLLVIGLLSVVIFALAALEAWKGPYERTPLKTVIFFGPVGLFVALLVSAFV